MNIKHCTALLLSIFSFAMHAQNAQTPQNPSIRNFLAAQAPDPRFSQEEIDKLVALIREIAKQTGEKLEEDDLILQTQMRLFCKQIQEQTGKLLTPTELFNNMNAACEDIGAWKMFCNEHGIEYITPMQLFEQFVAAQQQSKNIELNKKLLFGVGAGIGGLGGFAGGVMYADSVKYILKAGSVFALGQCAENHRHLTQNLPLNKAQRLGFNIIVDSIVKISTYHMHSNQSENAQIINELIPLINNESTSPHQKAAFRFILEQHNQKKLVSLEDKKKYDVTKRDYALLTAQAVSHNLIDIIPIPEKDSVYVCLNDDTLLSQNLLIRAAKESGKQCIQQAIETHLTSNQVKPENDPEKLAMPNLKKIGCIIAENTAKELGYSLIAQLAHKKIAPKTNEKTAAFLQACFPADGIPKNEFQEMSRIATISAITLCATSTITFCSTTGLNFVKNNAYRLSRCW